MQFRSGVLAEGRMTGTGREEAAGAWLIPNLEAWPARQCRSAGPSLV